MMSLATAEEAENVEEDKSEESGAEADTELDD